MKSPWSEQRSGSVALEAAEGGLSSQRLANMMSATGSLPVTTSSEDMAANEPRELLNPSTCAFHAGEHLGSPDKSALISPPESDVFIIEPELDFEPKDTTGRGKVKAILLIILRAVAILGLLYFFICSLDLLGSAFILIGGRTAGLALSSPLLNNPVCGLMIGLVTTAVLQSSSTTTSIVVTTVAANLVSVQMAIPIIMGANIGTSVTGILVAGAQAGDREQFRLAISGATCNDMFNWLTVAVMLPLEATTHCLYYLTTAIVGAVGVREGTGSHDFLKALTKPFTNLIVQIDKDVLGDIAADIPGADEKSLLKYWCEYIAVPVNETTNATGLIHTSTDLLIATDVSETSSISDVTPPRPTTIIGIEECRYLFHDTGLSEKIVGVCVLIMAFVMLMTCLICMVKILKSLLSGAVSRTVHRTINADFPGRAACLTGYLAILVGMVLTILVQSSSVVISALTPLVGLKLVTVRRVFPMMLGANLGTTSTAILASFAASGDRMLPAFQIALCHLFFNIAGITLWYVVPPARNIPLGCAKFLGRTMANYRWFAVVYGMGMFFALPGIVFALSIPGWQVLAGVGLPILAFLITILIINLLQKQKPGCLHPRMRTWDFLPEWMRSLEPIDRRLQACFGSCKCCQKFIEQEAVTTDSLDTSLPDKDECDKQYHLVQSDSVASSQRCFIPAELAPDRKSFCSTDIHKSDSGVSSVGCTCIASDSNIRDGCKDGETTSDSSQPSRVPSVLKEDERGCDSPA